MATHVRWASIALLHNVVRTLNYLHENEGIPLPKVEYRGKVKLHGTNCGVHITTRGGVYAQSRSKMLEAGSGDYKGFARWVEEHRDFWKSLKCPEDMLVFGEWCGPGVEKGMAISGLDRKVFAVFAIQYNRGEKAFYVFDPEVIKATLGDEHPDVFVLPWYGEPVTLDYSDPQALEVSAVRLNHLIAGVEKEDPWVKETFGISGVGEGLVFYPQSDTTMFPEGDFTLMVKVKGDKHRLVGKKAAKVKADKAEGVDEFVNLVVTEARLEQGITEACGGEYNMRHTGSLIRWVSDDVQKEATAELEAAGLTWKQVQKAVTTRAREWLKSKAL